MKAKFKLGASLYCYVGDFTVTMTLEDCIADAVDAGAKGIEILSEAHIPNYPNPSDKWIEHWHEVLASYGAVPTCYDCWVDSRLRKGRLLTAEESLNFLLADMKLAHRLGFKIMRPKLGVISDDLLPDPVWREMVERALPFAEKYDVRIAPEIHSPTPLKSKTVDGYLDLVAKTGTKHFGLLIDAGIFKVREGRKLEPGQWADPILAIDPRDLFPYLPYIFHIHGKFWEVTEDLIETSIPYDKVVAGLVEGGYEGYLSAEYEGDRTLYRGSEQMRRQFAMIHRFTAQAEAAGK
jgi:sugar phosphate isomerase/epimerase